MSIKVLFGNKIKEIRESRNLTQQQFAELVGLQPQTIAQIERGYRAVSFRTLEQLVNRLNIDYCDLFAFEKEQSSKALVNKIVKLTNKLERHELRYIIGVINQFNQYKSKLFQQL